MSGKTGVSINWGGFKEAVDKATSGISNTEKLMTTIGMAMKGQTIRRFEKGESPDGEAWKPSQRAMAENGKTLVDKGQLRSSIAFSATALEVHVGSNVAYARIHQLGGKAGRGRKTTIPARPYLGLSAEDQEEIAALVKEHMEGVFK